MSTVTELPTLVICDHSSRCSACGRAALTDGPTHDVVPGGPERIHGCGVAYVAAELDRAARTLSEPGARRIARELGLPYLGRAS